MMSGENGSLDIRQSGGRIALGLVVLLLLNVGAWFLLVRPRILELAQLEKDSLPRLEALRERTRQVEAREIYLENLDKATEDLTELRGSVLSTAEKRMVNVQMELEELAGRFHIDLDEVEYQPEYMIGEGLERFGMVVPLQGGYANLRHFIQAVESSDKFLVIERVAMDQAKDGGVLLRMNITLATYFDAPWLLEDRPPASARRRSNRGRS